MDLSTRLYFGRKRVEERRRVYQQRAVIQQEQERRDEIEEHRYQLQRIPYKIRILYNLK